MLLLCFVSIFNIEFIINSPSLTILSYLLIRNSLQKSKISCHYLCMTMRMELDVTATFVFLPQSLRSVVRPLQRPVPPHPQPVVRCPRPPARMQARSVRPPPCGGVAASCTRRETFTPRYCRHSKESSTRYGYLNSFEFISLSPKCRV